MKTLDCKEFCLISREIYQIHNRTLRFPENKHKTIALMYKLVILYLYNIKNCIKLKCKGGESYDKDKNQTIWKLC